MYYPWYMPLKRTNVYADAEDLAIIKAAATQRGVPEAEIIREAIHLAALAYRTWDEPFVSRRFSGPGQPADKNLVRAAVAARAGNAAPQDDVAR